MPGLSGTTADFGVSDHASIQNIFQNGGTIKAWHQQLGVSDANPAILAKSDFATKGWYLYYGDSTSTTGTILFAHAFASAIAVWTGTTTYDYNDPTLRLLHLTYDASTPSTVPNLYVNGIADPMVQVVAPSGAFVSDSGIALTIGSLAFTAGLQCFKGRIWNVGLENSVISAAQALSDWQSDSLTDTDWQAFWRMDEGDYASGCANTGAGGAGVASSNGAAVEYGMAWNSATAPT